MTGRNFVSSDLEWFDLRAVDRKKIRTGGILARRF